MAGATLSLIITSPLATIVEAQDIASFRADDESGGFGILPGHVDFLTAMPSSVARWRQASGPWHFCALQGAVLSVSGGTTIRIACRAGVLGDDLAVLVRDVRKRREAEQEAASSARVAQAKLHTKAIRQIMQHLSEYAGREDNFYG